MLGAEEVGRCRWVTWCCRTEGFRFLLTLNEIFFSCFLFTFAGEQVFRWDTQGVAGVDAEGGRSREE